MLINLEKSFKKIQSLIIKNFKLLEGSSSAEISSDVWKRPEGGGGKTFVISNGNFFDNCAVNFSSIYGKNMPTSALGKKLAKKIDHGYQAMGVSVISHPKNPYVPTSHMNVRLFGILDKNKNIKDWWIGGGYDLTPYISFSEDNISWHNSAKETLDKYNKNFYKSFSENCNKYFYIPHRKEPRGIGGLFFDYEQTNWENNFKFVRELGLAFIDITKEAVVKKMKTKWNLKQKKLQLYKRGRYIEFNLLYDKGTKFGLQTGGNIDAILMSLPPIAKWK